MSRVSLRKNNNKRPAENRLSLEITRIGPTQPVIEETLFISDVFQNQQDQAEQVQVPQTSSGLVPSSGRGAGRGASRGGRVSGQGEISKKKTKKKSNSKTLKKKVKEAVPNTDQDSDASTSLDVPANHEKVTTKKKVANNPTIIPVNDEDDQITSISRERAILIKNLLDQSVVDEFPSVIFTFGDTNKPYAPVLSWFHVKTKYTKKPSEIDLKCKLCDYVATIKIGNF